jgi:hypothetical protein
MLKIKHTLISQRSGMYKKTSVIGQIDVSISGNTILCWSVSHVGITKLAFWIWRRAILQFFVYGVFVNSEKKIMKLEKHMLGIYINK